ncbi:disease resistance protein Roq1-like [Bidens hawaiensis]|uniref:disease resistance protein Roq1-like n=1 Tax=Bidens hawaiensis TaxID=980011 RepID=UPI00404A763D
MASSSSSSHFIPAALVSQSWNHDVFISFRGEDTRKSFVDHLYMALVQQGIQTYKDDETLGRGESIGPALLKAIQDSHIAVIVFSENYADSSWCLDELAHIIECMDKKGQIVMPVFYDVDPSDVRKQNGKYGEAFTKHECQNKHKVESWRKALLKAGNLSGWVPKDFANGHEAKCIKDIVATIFSRLSPLINNVNRDLIGMETRMQDLKLKLGTGSGGVRMIGIWGVGGGGKTTVASVTYMEIYNQFEACCLLENVREESSKHGLKTMQEKFLTLVLKTNVVVGSEIEGKNMIKRRLCQKSVLVVLDDVDEVKQLEVLAGSHDWFGEGSRIIITTRDKHLLTRHVDMIYEVSLLSHDEATKLFNRHAYQKDKPVEDYEMLSQAVVSYAGGLPLALEILGSFLYDKDKDEWKCALAKLKSIPDVQVMERLKISYDGLKHDEKQLFLDIACFMRRSNIKSAITVLDACGFHPRIGIKVLVQKSLIKVSNGKFDMHDLVEELAHYIVKERHPNHPEKRSRIWRKKDIIEFFTMEEDALLTEIEVLAFPQPAFDDEENLLFSENYYNHRRLPRVIANMKKLRWIDWERYPGYSFPSKFQPTELGCLMLRCYNLKQLWKGYKHLPRLKILDLWSSWNLKRTPDFKGLPCLERLNLGQCEQLKKIHPSIGYHERLVWVSVNQCSKLKSFPPIVCMKKLETLDLSYCYQLQKFPHIQANMDNLVLLGLRSTNIDIIPPSVGQFCTNLASFDLFRCHKLKRIEGNFRLLKHLEYLNLSECYQLENLAVDFFNKECCLEELHLTIKWQDSTSLKNRIGLQSFYRDKSLSMNLPQFPRFLRKLYLCNSNLGDEHIPSDMSGLVYLQILDLSENHFSRLHFNLSQIPSLKFLNLSWCNNLVELPDLPSSIAILNADYCESLQSVGELSNCKWLWKVSLLDSVKLIGGERVVHSMLQVNAAADRLMSIALPQVQRLESGTCREKVTLQLPLPHNWYSEFGGFLVSAYGCEICGCDITIMPEILSTDSQLDHWEEFDKNPESYTERPQVGYIPFASLSHTSWWNPKCTVVTFRTYGMSDTKVGLVPRKSQSDDCSECLEEPFGYNNAFKIEDSSASSSIFISWKPCDFL